MNAWALYRSLGAIDARNVARDSLLRWMLVLTPALGLLLRLAVPPATALASDRFGFDLAVYYPLIMSFLPLAVAGMVGTVIGFLLLDQRDEQTLVALVVTPLSLGDYLRYRLAVPVLVSMTLTGITLPLAGLTSTTPLQAVLTAATAAPIAPLYALGLGAFAANKVQGFALLKGAGVVMLPCIASYVIAPPMQYAFGVLPHFWSLKVFWLFHEGSTFAALLHALIGIAWQATLLIWLTRHFSRSVGR